MIEKDQMMDLFYRALRAKTVGILCQEQWLRIFRHWPEHAQFWNITLSFAIIPSAGKTQVCNSMQKMPTLLLSLIRFVRLVLSGHQAVALENVALRLQLAAFQRK